MTRKHTNISFSIPDLQSTSTILQVTQQSSSNPRLWRRIININFVYKNWDFIQFSWSSTGWNMSIGVSVHTVLRFESCSNKLLRPWLDLGSLWKVNAATSAGRSAGTTKSPENRQVIDNCLIFTALGRV